MLSVNFFSKILMKCSVIIQFHHVKVKLHIYSHLLKYIKGHIKMYYNENYEKRFAEQLVKPSGLRESGKL